MHQREAEERDIISGRDGIVIGMLELVGDLECLGALVLVVRPVQSVTVYAHLHA